MPIRYELDRPGHLIRTRCIGEAMFDEVVAHFDELAPLPAPLDLTDMDSLPEGEQIRGVASVVERFPVDVKWGAWAVVTDRDALFGMIRMLHVFVEEHLSAFGVFRSIE